MSFSVGDVGLSNGSRGSSGAGGGLVLASKEECGGWRSLATSNRAVSARGVVFMRTRVKRELGYECFEMRGYTQGCGVEPARPGTWIWCGRTIFWELTGLGWRWLALPEWGQREWPGPSLLFLPSRRVHLVAREVPREQAAHL